MCPTSGSCLITLGTIIISDLKVLVTQLCLTLCDPVDCSPPSSVNGILQARILEWVAIPFCRASSWTRHQTWSPALQADFLPSEPPEKANNFKTQRLKSYENKQMVLFSGFSCSGIIVSRAWQIFLCLFLSEIANTLWDWVCLMDCMYTVAFMAWPREHFRSLPMGHCFGLLYPFLMQELALSVFSFCLFSIIC